MKKITTTVLMTIALLLSVNFSFGQTVIYTENFTGQNNKGAKGPLPVTTDLTGVTWSIDVSPAILDGATDWFKVNSEKLEARDVDGDVIWYSPSINISAYNNVEFKLDASEVGQQTAANFLKTEYRIDGGTWTTASVNRNLTDDFTSVIVKQASLSGNTLEIKVTINNNTDAKKHRIDNITVKSSEPIITVTPASLNGFVYVEGNGPSTEQSFQVNGDNLTNDITITPPANFEISLTTGGAFSATNPITLTPSTGTITNTTIYVRQIAGLLIANSPFSGTIACTSTGATQVDVALNGIVSTYLPCDSQIGKTLKFESFEGSGDWNYAVSPAIYDANSHIDVWAITGNLGSTSNSDKITSGSDNTNFWGMRNLENSNGGSITACECEVTNSGTLKVAANDFLSVESDITVSGSGGIQVAHTGSLVQINDNAIITGNAFQIKKTTTPYVEYDFTYWSSPVNSVLPIGAIFYESAQHRIFDFTTVNFEDINNGNYPQSISGADSFDDDGDDWNIATSEAMAVGKGYIVEGKGAAHPYDAANLASGLTQTVIFPGIINNGVITAPVVLDKYNATHAPNAENTNANLIGNPYPSAIDLSMLGAQVYHATNNTTGVLEGTFYFWTHDDPIGAGTNTGPNAYNFNNDDYSVATVDYAGVYSATASSNVVGTGAIMANKFVASGQGFFANAKVAGNVVFNNSMRVVGDNNHFLRPTNNTIDRFWLNLTKSDVGIFRQIYIGFHDNATNDFLNGQDGERMANGDNTDFYSLISSSNRKYAIQNLATFNDNKTVSLGMDIIEVGTYEISLGNLEGVFANNQTIYLQDKLTGSIHDFSNGSYSFTTTIGSDINNRFVIMFRPSSLGVDTLVSSDSLTISNLNEQISFTITNGKTITNIQGYDVLGKLIIQESNVDSDIHSIQTTIENGTIVIFKVTLNNGQTLSKKFVKL